MTTVLDVDWQGLPDGAYTQAMHKARFGSSPNDSWWASKKTTIKNGCLQVEIPANTMGTGVAPVIFHKISPTEKATISQTIEFVSGWDWGLGGKWGFGLGGTDDGSNPPTGGAAPTHGWSIRPMSLSPGAGAGSRPPGSAIVYGYYQNRTRTDSYGQNIFYEKPYAAGQVMTQHTQIGLNTVGQANGLLKAWFDGQSSTSPPINRNDIEYRNAQGQTINWLTLACFRGGADSAWASPKGGYVRLHHVSVTAP